MDNREIFAHYTTILDNLIDDYNFFRFYFQSSYSLDEDIVGEYEEGYFREENIDIRFGVSRGCIIDHNFPYVVKFDLDEEQGIYKGTCENEVMIYEAAKLAGFEKYLCEPIYLGEYVRTFEFYPYNEIIRHIDDFYGFNENDFTEKLYYAMDEGLNTKTITVNIPLYAYPRARKYFLKFDYSNEAKNEVIQNGSPLTERSSAIGCAFIEEYGKMAFKEFSEFLEEYEVNDIHSGNIMSLNGHLIITDFSGYNEDE